MAFAFDFEKRMILLNHRKVEPEGVLSFLVSNTQQFSRAADVLPIIQKEVARACWSHTFSKQLQIIDCSVDGPVAYGRATGEKRRLRIAHLTLRNGRDDLTARNSAVRLLAVKEGTLPEGQSIDPTRLKVMEVPGYSLDISPKHQWRFDIFGIDDDHYPQTFLVSERDVNPWTPIITTNGTHRLTYEVTADGFPDLKVVVLLTLDMNSHEPHVYILEPQTLGLK